MASSGIPDIEEVVTEKQEIELEDSISARHDNSASIEVEEPVDEDVYVFPASFAQKRLWFLDQFEPNSPFYNIPLTIRFDGQLDVAILDKSINAVVQRHESLRTFFLTIDDQPVQVIRPEFMLTLLVPDLSGLPEGERQIEMMRLAKKEAMTPFNLATGPLIRVILVKVAKNDHVLLMTMHHIISDGWSMGIFTREVALFYDAFINRKNPSLPPLAIQYGDFARWQQEWLTGEVLERQLEYWNKQLGGALPVLELPMDRPRPAVQTYRGANVSIQISRELTYSLNNLCQQNGVTLFMILLAALQTLLYRYTGLKDICIGSPIANRTMTEIEGIIGLFVNTLVFRTNLTGNPGFIELLIRVRNISLKAYENQDIPFEQLVDALQPVRDMSHSPLFQVMFILQNVPQRFDIALSQLKLSQLEVDSGTATFDLTLMVTEQPDGMNVMAEYNTDLFAAATIYRLLNHFQTLLEGIVIDPNQQLSQLPILCHDENYQILNGWNDTDAYFPQHRCIHHLFEMQVEKTPAQVAVVFAGKYLTYQQLNRKANQLARHLKKRGIQSNMLVGICLERSLELMVAVLGVLKAGAAYVPIDPMYPEERIAFMITDANIPVLLTQTSLVAGLPDHQVPIICLDREWDAISIESDDNPGYPLTPQNLAYVIYTSGSTGQSKGAMVHHRGLVNAYFAWEKAYDLKSGVSSHLQMASFSFDVFSGDWIRALCSGGKLVIVARDILLEPQALYALMRNERIDCAEFVPVVLRTLIQYLDNTGQALDFMRILIAGSDTWYLSEYRKFLRFCSPETRLVNSFGLTEATIDSTYFTGTNLTLADDRVVPIGRPFANNQIYLLAPNLVPVPVGVPGELYVGGAGVACGYLNRPELTAATFVPDPFSASFGARLYKTGDLARYLPDGNIEFLGRMDHQVKIRGFRIELGEIESALAKHPAVQEAIAVAREVTPGDKRIVAYIVKNHQPTPMARDLIAFLQDKLPDYMLPSAFVVLDELPLLPNGKVDRQSLPAPVLSRTDLDDTFVAPQTPTEEVLAGTWSRLLHLDKVGRYDNFFLLGGHSLLATQLATRIREYFRVEFPLRRIFEIPVLADLARSIDLALLSENGRECPPIRPAARLATGEMPLSFAQQRLWFIDRLQPGIPFYNIPEVNRITGPLNIFALAQSINEIVRRHEVLRTGFDDVDGTARQVILASLTIDLPVIDLRQLPEQEREAAAKHLATTLVTKPFNLAQAPLLRVLLLWLAENDYLVVFTIHHIISDGWSSGVLMQELGLLYDACCKGQPAPLPELPIQYADFAYWQRNWLQGEILEQQLQYWKNKLQNAPPLLELPTDRPRPAVQNFKGAMCYFDLPVQLAAELRELSRQQGVTMFMTMLAAFLTLLSRYSGQNDLSVGTPIAGRTRAEIENLIGFFVNTLVLRTDLAGNPNFRELLARVRDTCLAAYTHQDLPFEMLVAELQPERNLGHTPLFQVMFVLQNVTSRQLKFANLELTPVEIDRGATQFDLTLWINEAADGMNGLLEYNPELFNKSTIDRMLAHFCTLLEAIVANPDQPIAALPMLTEAETQQILLDWNDTITDLPDDNCFQQLFEIQAEQKPDAIALCFNEHQLTYRTLNQRANQLAHYLQKMDVGPDILVGIYMERSLEMVIGLLAILKTGAAYLPLEPSYPAQRLQFILTDTRIPVLLSQQHLAAQFPACAGKIICLDTDWDLVAHENADNLVINITGESLAYCIYTSGSTGQPKGTLVTHNGLTNYLNWCRMAYPLAQGRGTPVHATIAFDATITALLAPLLVGATVTLIPETKDLEVLATTLTIDREFSLVKITPAHLELLGQQLATENVTDLTRAFIIGGENLTTKHISFWQKNAPATVLINEYGPTETVVGCCVYWLDSESPDTASIPIGRPIRNTRLYILNGNLNPAGIGIPGELYIAGAGVARGYLNRPDLTAEKFVPDLFSQKPGDRFYKSGDLARFRPDGTIEFLGRIDNQVKIRGFRIEIGEIEAVLKEHPKLQDVVVLAREDIPGEKRLVAYVVAQQQPAPTVTELRHFLKSKLPEYMIPPVYVPMAAFPLTPNGKIDRKKLPAPNQLRPELTDKFVSPRTPVEIQLAQIWSQVLGIEKIGSHDNFFELGGDSILSIQVIARANQAGLQLTPRQLFQAPTIAELATLAGTTTTITAEQGIITGKVPLTPIQQWFFQLHLPQPHHWNQSVLVKVRPSLDPVILANVVRHILQHHDTLRLRFYQTDGGWEQAMVAMEETIPFSVIDISLVPDKDLDKTIEDMATALQVSLNLTNGPICRIAYFDRGPEKAGRLLIVIHHLAVDAVSWRILLEDFHIAYQQLLEGKPVQLPNKTTSFKEWAFQLTAFAQSEAIQPAIDYWMGLPQPQVAPLPVDFSGDNTEASCQTVAVALSLEETETLLQEVLTVYRARVHEILLSTLALVLSRWVNTRSIVIDLEGHGREEIMDDVDLSRSAGWFTSLFPLHINLGQDPTPGAALKLVKEQLRNMPHRGLSFGILAYPSDKPEYIDRLRNLTVAEISFNYLGQFGDNSSEATDSPFAATNESRGPERTLSGTRPYLIEINGGITDGRLELIWSYSKNRHRRETIANLAQNYLEELQSLIIDYQSPGAESYTPSDFSRAKLSENDLETLMAVIADNAGE